MISTRLLAKATSAYSTRTLDTNTTTSDLEKQVKLNTQKIENQAVTIYNIEQTNEDQNQDIIMLNNNINNIYDELTELGAKTDAAQLNITTNQNRINVIDSDLDKTINNVVELQSKTKLEDEITIKPYNKLSEEGLEASQLDRNETITDTILNIVKNNAELSDLANVEIEYVIKPKLTNLDIVKDNHEDNINELQNNVTNINRNVNTISDNVNNIQNNVTNINNDIDTINNKLTQYENNGQVCSCSQKWPAINSQIDEINSKIYTLNYCSCSQDLELIINNINNVKTLYIENFTELLIIFPADPTVNGTTDIYRSYAKNKNYLVTHLHQPLQTLYGLLTNYHFSNELPNDFDSYQFGLQLYNEAIYIKSVVFSFIEAYTYEELSEIDFSYSTLVKIMENYHNSNKSNFDYRTYNENNLQITNLQNINTILNYLINYLIRIIDAFHDQLSKLLIPDTDFYNEKEPLLLSLIENKIVPFRDSFKTEIEGRCEVCDNKKPSIKNIINNVNLNSNELNNIKNEFENVKYNVDQNCNKLQDVVVCNCDDLIWNNIWELNTQLFYTFNDLLSYLNSNWPNNFDDIYEETYDAIIYEFHTIIANKLSQIPIDITDKLYELGSPIMAYDEDKDCMDYINLYWTWLGNLYNIISELLLKIFRNLFGEYNYLNSNFNDVFNNFYNVYQIYKQYHNSWEEIKFVEEVSYKTHDECIKLIYSRMYILFQYIISIYDWYELLLASITTETIIGEEYLNRYVNFLEQDKNELNSYFTITPENYYPELCLDCFYENPSNLTTNKRITKLEERFNNYFEYYNDRINETGCICFWTLYKIEDIMNVVLKYLRTWSEILIEIWSDKPLIDVLYTENYAEIYKNELANAAQTFHTEITKNSIELVYQNIVTCDLARNALWKIDQKIWECIKNCINDAICAFDGYENIDDIIFQSLNNYETNVLDVKSQLYNDYPQIKTNNSCEEDLRNLIEHYLMYKNIIGNFMEITIVLIENSSQYINNKDVEIYVEYYTDIYNELFNKINKEDCFNNIAVNECVYCNNPTIKELYNMINILNDRISELNQKLNL